MYKTAISSLVVPVLMFGSFAGVAFAASASAPMISSNLMVGSSGSEVVALQTYLEANDLLVLPEGVQMGHFGALTKAAVMAYQESMTLPATGFVDHLHAQS